MVKKSKKAKKNYDWKIGKYKVPANVAGREIEKIIETNGVCTPALLLDESRDEKAPLHFEFEWDDSVAAEKHRLTQASDMIRCLVIVEERGKDQEPIRIRAFQFVETDPESKTDTRNGYITLQETMERNDYGSQIRKRAAQELNAYQAKYSDLIEFYKLKSNFASIMQRLEQPMQVVAMTQGKITQ
ncbi:MAG: hypothetical protein BWY71_00100 [Planctomycetes bacterium ADurb.Bin412]|nr:MAG: hypothetical protein BWY71_00100 [Planctomycetes bacterium ADurb.Bin412]